MTPQQLEAAVLGAVERAKKRQPIEDDRIEMKRDWPTAKQSRQLAGSCNRANGEWLIYVIGVDESDGSIHPLGHTDPATWWAQMSSRFEGISPEVVSHINIPIDTDETVVGILFRTDRAPYVIKLDGGSSELEVPIRDATRTRSARRAELIRMLAPTTTVPPLLLLEADVEANWHAANGRTEERLIISGECVIYLEHVGGTSVLLPEHEMTAAISADGTKHAARIDFWKSRHNPPPPPLFGVHVSSDGVVASGPGSFLLSLNCELDPSEENVRALAILPLVELTYSTGVAGSGRSARVDGALQRVDIRPDQMPLQHRKLGRWKVRATASDDI